MFPNRTLCNLIDTWNLPVEHAIELAEKIYHGRPIELFVIGDTEVNLVFIAQLGACYERDELNPRIQKLLGSLDKVDKIFPLCVDLSGNEEVVDKNLLDQHLMNADKLINSPEFCEVIKHLSR